MRVAGVIVVVEPETVATGTEGLPVWEAKGVTMQSQKTDMDGDCKQWWSMMGYRWWWDRNIHWLSANEERFRGRVLEISEKERHRRWWRNSQRQIKDA